MSDRRAQIRRERAEFRKIAKHKSPMGDMERAVAQGIIDGRILAACIVFGVLKDHFNFGTKRLGRLLELSNKECGKFEQAATQFNIQFYKERMVERTQLANISLKEKDLKERAYTVQRCEVFSSACAIMFIVLNQAFGFSSNEKGTGRTDVIMEYALDEFIKVNRENRSISQCVKELGEKTGIILAD